MHNSPEQAQLANLVYFYTKKGERTTSPYEAQFWKSNSTPVYVRLTTTDGTILEKSVTRIHFKHNRNASVTVRIKQSNRRYELVNVFCDIRILYYDELAFFVDKGNGNLSVKEAENSIIDILSKEDFKKAKENGQTISALYFEDPHYGNTMAGIIPDVQQYDEKLQIITTKKQKIFLLQK